MAIGRVRALIVSRSGIRALGSLGQMAALVTASTEHTSELASDSLLEQYTKLNDGYAKNLVFRLGQKAGFFSEYNNMLLAMEYCLERSIRFSIYSKYANFGFKKGWQDYFLPFCRESKNRLHQRYNLRHSGSRLVRVYTKVMGRLKLPLLTQHLWLDIRNHKDPQCNPGNFFDNMRTMRERLNLIHNMVWRYNPHTECKVKKLVEAANLKTPYIGFHIRGGDKYVEHPPINFDRYIQIASELSSIKTAFVSTDDFDIFLRLQDRYQDWSFKTLCLPEQRGYFHKNYRTRPKDLVVLDHIQLFASMDLLEGSEVFIGTFSSNVGMNIGIRKSAESCFGVDFPDWQIW